MPVNFSFEIDINGTNEWKNLTSVQVVAGGSADVTFYKADPAGNGRWMKYKSIAVAPGEICEQVLTSGFQARWIRFSDDKDCRATAFLKYE